MFHNQNFTKMGVIQQLFTLSIIFTFVLLFAPGIPPYDVEFKELTFHKLPFEGALGRNNLLDSAEMVGILPEGGDRSFQGPESFAVKDNFLYTGVNGGTIYRLDVSKGIDGHWEAFYKLGCDGPKCARPLGLSFDPSGKRLIVADGAFGLYQIDMKTKDRQVLASPDEEIDGKKNLLLNNLAVAKNGDVYYTVLSTRFPVNEGAFEALAMSSPSGRVMKFDAAKKINEVLIEDAGSPNGIVLSEKQDFFLYSDISKGIIKKFYLTGDKSDQEEVLISQSPGLVDNLKPNGKGGFLAAVALPFDPDEFNPLTDVLAKYPLFSRKLLLRILYNFKKTLDTVAHLLPANEALTNFVYNFGSIDSVCEQQKSVPGLLVEYDFDGNLLRSWHGRKTPSLSEGFLHDGHIYLGSFCSSFVARIPYA